MTSNADAAPAAWSEILTRRYGGSLALVSMGVWLHAADSLLVATMLPAMVGEIAGAELVAWTFALYEIGSILAGAASGLLALRLGLRLPMAAASLLFAVGCAIAAAAPAMWVVLVGRLLQGLGGGGLVALSFVAVSLLFPARLGARAIAAISTLWGVSAFLGPLVGGLFVEYSTWRGGFWFFAVQAVALAVWILAGLGGERRAGAAGPAGERFPVVRLAFLSAGVVLVAWGGIDIAPGSTSGFVLAGLFCLYLFLRLDARREASRLLPRRALSLVDPIGAGLTLILCFAIATIAITAYGPLLMTALHGASALVAGYIVAASSIGWSVVAVVVSGAPERDDPKYIFAGMLLVAASIVGFFVSVPSGPLWLIGIFAVMEGGGFGMAWAFLIRRATALAPPGEVERVNAAIPTVHRLGFALGAAYVGIVANASGLAEGDGPADLAFVARMLFAASLPFALVGLVATARFVSSGRGTSGSG